MNIETKQQRRKRYLKKVRSGRCVSCTNAASKGSVYCDHHRQYNREKSARHNKKRLQRYIKEHRCTRCSAPLEENEGRTCMNCNDPETKYRNGGIYATY